jgi:hypothetical protein
MSDDLLERLGRIEHASRPAAEWDDVLEGRSSAAEVVQRRRAEGDDVDELEALARASAPLDAAERKAWVRRLRAATATSAAPPPIDPPIIDLAQQRTRRRPWMLPGAAVLVAVAAVLVLWMWPRPAPPIADGEGGTPLPSFSLVVRNDTIDDVRGGGTSDGPARYRSSSIVHWMVSPDEPVAGPLELGVIVEGEGGRACLARPVVTRASGDGVFEVRGTIEGVLGLAPGRWRLSLVVAAEGELPTDALVACPKVVRVDTLVETNSGAALRRASMSRVEPYEIVVEAD